MASQKVREGSQKLSEDKRRLVKALCHGLVARTTHPPCLSLAKVLLP
jgi:hypothetical protein